MFDHEPRRWTGSSGRQVGSMFRLDPYSPAIDADPFAAYRRLRDDFPCFWSDEANAWVLSRFADIVAALNNWRTYSSAKGNLMTEVRNRAGATIGTTDPPRHDRLRGLVQYAFMKRNLDSLTPAIRDIARDVVGTQKSRWRNSTRRCRAMNAPRQACRGCRLRRSAARSGSSSRRYKGRRKHGIASQRQSRVREVGLCSRGSSEQVIDGWYSFG